MDKAGILKGFLTASIIRFGQDLLLKSWVGRWVLVLQPETDPYWTLIRNLRRWTDCIDLAVQLISKMVRVVMLWTNRTSYWKLTSRDSPRKFGLLHAETGHFCLGEKTVSFWTSFKNTRFIHHFFCAQTSTELTSGRDSLKMCIILNSIYMIIASHPSPWCQTFLSVLECFCL